MGKRIAVLAVLPLVASCLPARDNPFDPKNAPIARLVVREDARLPGGTCPLVMGTGSETAQASRGACLALDASASVDKDGGPIFDFDFFAHQGDVTLSLGSVTGDSSGGLVLTEDVRRGDLVPGGVVFEVIARASGGASGRAQAFFALTNATPIAKANDPRVLPMVVPWLDDECLDVVFDASATEDADGDVLTYDWQFPAFAGACAEPAATPTTAKSVTRKIPLGQEQRIISTLTVSDGASTSAPFRAIVATRNPDPWITVPSSVGNLARLDSSLEILDDAVKSDFIGGAISTTALALSWEEPGVVRLAFMNANDRENPYFGPITIPDEAFPVTWPEGDGTSTWVVLFDNPLTVRKYDVEGGATPVVDELLPESALADFFPLSAVDDDEGLWITSIFSGTLVRFDAAGGAGELILDDPERGVSGLARRPGTREIWYVETGSLSGEASDPNTYLVRADESGEISRHAIGAGTFSGQAWASPDEVWIGKIGSGLVLIDVTRFGTSLDPVVFEVSLPADVPLLFADVTADRVWGTGFNGSTFEVTRQGDVIAHVGDVILYFQEPDGRFWSLDSESLRGFAVDDRAIAAPSDIDSSEVGYDFLTGGAWTVGSLGGFRHVGSDGRLLESVANAVDAASGNTVGIGPAQRMRVSPDGTRLWHYATASRSLDLYELDVRPIRRRMVLDSAAAYPILSPYNQDGGSAVFEIADPSTEPFAWVAVPTSGGNAIAIATVDTAGQLTTRFPISSTELPQPLNMPFVANVPGSNRACIATTRFGFTNPPLRLRMIEPDATPGTPLLLDLNTTLPTDQSLFGIFATHDPETGLDLCWIAYGRQTAFTCPAAPTGELHLRGYQAGSTTPVRSYDDATSPGYGFVPSSHERVWYSSRFCEPFDDDGLEVRGRNTRLDIGPASFKKVMFSEIE